MLVPLCLWDRHLRQTASRRKDLSGSWAWRSEFTLRDPGLWEADIMADMARGKLLIYWLAGREGQVGRGREGGRARTYPSNTYPITYFLKQSLPPSCHPVQIMPRMMIPWTDEFTGDISSGDFPEPQSPS